MARRAFLLGRCTGTLRHCAAFDEQGDLVRSDVWLMRDCLRRELDFEQIEIADCNASFEDILGQLEAVTGACVPEDTFVFYFAGHSLGKKGLQLVMKDPPGKRGSWIPADHIVGFIEDCAALYKLMILDSCESGKGAIGMLPDPGSHIRVLTATDGALNAQERDELQAGIFTFHLWKALTDKTLRHTGDKGVLDVDGNLCLERVHRWLRRAVPGYAKEGEPKIPEPQLYGGAGKEIFFATGLQPYRGRSFAPDRVGELIALLDKSTLPVDLVYRRFNDLLDSIEPAYEWPRPGESATLTDLVEYLADMGVRPANIPVALLELATVLSGEVLDGKELRDWIDRNTRTLVDSGELSPAQRAALGSSRRTKAARRVRPFSLLIVPGQPDKEKRDTYANGGAWLDTGGDTPLCVAALDCEIGVGDVPGLIYAALHDERVAARLRQGKTRTHLTLEIFLPRGLLSVDPDDWTPWHCDPDVPTPPLSFHYNLVVRPWERIAPAREGCWTEGWEQSWGLCGDCRAHNADDEACVSWLDAPARDYGTRLGQGACLFVLKTPPEPPDDPVRLSNDLARPLVHGVAKLLWCDVPLAEDLERRLCEKMKGRKLGDLPDALREVRVGTWEASGERDTGHLHLLWDDPNRKPRIWTDPGGESADTEPLPHLVSAYDQFST